MWDDEAMRTLQHGINERQSEMNALTTSLGRSALLTQRLSNWLRVATICLSALASLKAVFDKSLGGETATTLLAFALLNVAITVLLGLETAFKFDKRAAESNALSAIVQSAKIAADTEWRKKVGSLEDSDLREAARDILTLQDAALAEALPKAAALGLVVSPRLRSSMSVEPDSGSPPPFAA